MKKMFRQGSLYRQLGSLQVAFLTGNLLYNMAREKYVLLEILHP